MGGVVSDKRREQIEKAAKNNYLHSVPDFIFGAEWADANPHPLSYSRDREVENLQDKLAIAMEALESVANGVFEDNKPWAKEKAHEALTKIKS